MTGLLAMAMLIFFTPNIFALNRGHILRNIALWLAIFLGLALIYQNFGPASPHPLFRDPSSLQDMRGASPKSDKPGAAKDKGNVNDGTQGFTPPKE